MTGVKAHIITQLQKDILPLQGFKKIWNPCVMDIVPAPIKNAFPNAQFPLGAIHEFISTTAEDEAATKGFISGILGSIMRKGGICIWINSRTIFPPALKSFGIAPEKIIFIDLKKEKEILWAIEEALKCEGLPAVVGELHELSFTVSRRLQLAVEQSRVTGFILPHNSDSINTTACIARWKITSIPGKLENDMPGVGFPRWNVELLKVRNGKPGKWQIEFSTGRFRHIPMLTAITQDQKKTG